jgi:hypothetical protein
MTCALYSTGKPYSPLQKAGYMPSYVFLLAGTTKTRILSNVNRVYYLTVVDIAF